MAETNRNVEDLTTDDYRARLREGELPNQEPAKLEIPETYAPPRETVNPAERQREYDELKQEEEIKKSEVFVGGNKKENNYAEELKAREQLENLFSEKEKTPAPKLENPLETPNPVKKPEGIIVEQHASVKKYDKKSADADRAEKENEERAKQEEYEQSKKYRPNTGAKKIEYGSRAGLEVRNKAEQERDKKIAEAKRVESGKLDFISAAREMRPGVENLYREFSGQDLAVKTKERVLQEAQAQKLRIVSKAELFSPQRIQAEEEKTRQQEKDFAVRGYWYSQQPEEVKQAWFTDPVKKAQYETEIAQLKQDVEQKRQAIEQQLQKKLGKDYSLPEGAYYMMMRWGYKVDQIKVKSRWGRFWTGNAIEIPGIKAMTKEDFKISVQEKQEAFDDLVKTTAQLNLEDVYTRGRKRLLGLRAKCKRDVLNDSASEVEKSMKQKAAEEAKAKENPIKKLEIFANVGQRRTPEFIKAVQEVKKEVDEDMKRREKIKKQIAALADKKKKGQPLTPKEIALLNSL